MLDDKRVLITGSGGFIGRNLKAALSRKTGAEIFEFDAADELPTLESYLRIADIVFHLAGVNRPQHVDEFARGNAALTEAMVFFLERWDRRPLIVFTSSIQAGQDNPYGKSKKDAEDTLVEFAARTGAPAYLYRLTNVFGKWSRPNYNSVVSTFCYNIAHGLEITISDPENVVDLVYIDDVVAEFLAVLSGASRASSTPLSIGPTYRVTLEQLAAAVCRLGNVRESLTLPDLSDVFMRKLYATYLSYLEPDGLVYDLKTRSDERGALAELIKSPHFGQIFVSRSHGGVLRGNHYHDSKIEKFCVLDGEAAVRLRKVDADDVIAYRVSGSRWQVVDIPPGYTHHIENLTDREMTVLFWANEMFDPELPDTYFCEV